MATAGKTLRLERVRANLTIVDVAARMGLSRQSVWVIERSAQVGEDRARQYRSAIASLRDATETSGDAA